MPMISSLRIGSFDFSVSLNTDIRKDGNIGWLDHQHSAIHIADDMDAHCTLQTILHEVVHEILIQSGQRLGSKEEGVVDAVAFGWYQVMRDNPQLVKLITKGK